MRQKQMEAHSQTLRHAMHNDYDDDNDILQMKMHAQQVPLTQPHLLNV